MTPVRLFLDAHMLFSAAYSPDGRAAALIELAELGRCTLFTSPHALTEARRNLEMKRPEVIRHLEEEMLTRVALVAEAGPEEVRAGLEQGLPLKDAPILGAASRASVDLLVTGDVRHFGHFSARP